MRLTALISIFMLFLMASCSHTIYVVRHAEKQTGTDPDPALTELGALRSEALKDSLKDKRIQLFYSTNTKRTRTTAEPTARFYMDTIQIYSPRPDSLFYKKIIDAKKNILIVGHSNTIDDIVNGLMGEKKIANDFQDWEYDNLFVIKIKGKKKTLIAKKYGPLSIMK